MTTRIFYQMLALGSLLFLIASCKKEAKQPPIALSCDFFQTSQTLVNTKRNVDYYINCVMTVSAPLVIEPGVTIEFGPDAGIEVEGGTGSINAVGSSSEKITFRGESAVAGSWKGIYINTNDVNNQLKYCDISYAGGSSFNSNGDKGSIILWAESRLDMDHISISNSADCGLSAVYGDAVFTLNNSQISNCALAPVHIASPYIGNLNASNTFLGNTKDYIHVSINGYEIYDDMTVSRLDVPYRMIPTGSYNALSIRGGVTTISEDVVFEFSAGVVFYIDDAGTLKVNPTGNPAVFTGVDKVAGAWKGLYFQFTQGLNVLDNVKIENAGSTYDNGNFGIAMWGSPKLSIRNIQFKDISGCAVVDYNNSMASPNPNFTDNGGHTYTNVTGANMCY